MIYDAKLEMQIFNVIYYVDPICVASTFFTSVFIEANLSFDFQIINWNSELHFCIL